MSAVLLSMAFFLAGAQAPADTPAQASVAPETAAPVKEEPKLVCKYEFATGSRVQKVKVCRPANATSSNQDTKLQRELSKNGDFRDPQSGGFGN
jgi:hypothetical protein